MAYLKDIINRNFDNCIDYKITIIGEDTLIIEGFKRILTFSSQEITLSLNKATLQVIGESLVIEMMEQDYIQIGGRIGQVARIDRSVKHD